MAAGALLTDYVLTVAVSIAAGVAALTSIFPGLFDYRVVVGVGVRGAALRSATCAASARAATIFAAPTYVYLRGDLRPAGVRPVPLRHGHAARVQPPPGWLEGHEHRPDARACS